MMRGLKYLALGAMLILCATAHGQQTIEQWQEVIRRAQEEIRLNKELDAKYKNERQSNERQLNLTISRISSRRDIVNSQKKQMDLIARNMNSTDNVIKGLSKDQEKLRKEYAEMVRAAYKNYKLNNFLVFVFASEDFNDATRRVEFMRRYNRHREAKAAELQAVTDSLGVHLSTLERSKDELAKTQAAYDREIASLREDEKQQRTQSEDLRKKEGKLSTATKAKEKQIEDAKKMIAKIMDEQVRKSSNETVSEAQREYNVVLTGRFDQNKGKLPFPIRGGVVLEKFGSSNRNLKHPNNGIRIAAGSGAAVTSVFDGEVVQVFGADAWNTGIIIRHGDYYTLYVNLASVTVRKGDQVSLNQRLGTIPAGDDPDAHFLEFQIGKKNARGDATDFQNPELWLRR